VPWARVGDNAATYPPLLSVAGVKGADERTVNEVAGFVFRCAWQVAAHTTDYVIDIGTVQMIGGARWSELVKLAERVKLLERTRVNGLLAWRLVEKDDFIHIRTVAEMEWNNRQRNDTRDPRLMVPIRQRDGDQCRWCRIVVVWSGPSNNRSATVDHLVPGEAATVDTAVIACWECNHARNDDRSGKWEAEHAVFPPPVKPLYGSATVKYLFENAGVVVEQNIGRPRKTVERASDPDTARTTQPHGASPVRPGGAATAPATDPLAGAPPGESSRVVHDSPSDEFELAGSGRVGSDSGSDGLGSDGLGSDGLGRSRRRGRRGSGR